MRILLLILTDDPFDPAGVGRFGSSPASFSTYRDNSSAWGTMSRLFCVSATSANLTFSRSALYVPSTGWLSDLHQEVHHHSLGYLREDLIASILALPLNGRSDVLQTGNWLSGAVGLALVPDIADKHVP